MYFSSRVVALLNSSIVYANQFYLDRYSRSTDVRNIFVPAAFLG